MIRKFALEKKKRERAELAERRGKGEKGKGRKVESRE